jgi:excinuclease UvrABC helicase subunit UvrB
MDRSKPNYLSQYFSKFLNTSSLEERIESELNKSEMTKKVYEKDGFIVTEISGKTPSGGFYSETTYSYKASDNNAKIIEQKNAELNEAIKQQDFERATILRDTIAALRENQ